MPTPPPPPQYRQPLWDALKLIHPASEKNATARLNKPCVLPW